MTRAIRYRRYDHKNYRFILTAPLTLDTNIIGRTIKTDWVELTRNGPLIIADGYAWDGEAVLRSIQKTACVRVAGMMRCIS